jgi:TP901 family phage tail tape measure protein
MVEAATNFRKSGFNNADSAMLAQVAAQYQNIADTAVSASDAAASITSQIRAFGEDASFATTVINAYNEVANNFSVGTNDISNAIEIASSGMATYGNSFQQVIGLVTSGTEIMQGRASQVARGLSTIAARIVKNQDALAEYGIQVEKTDGSLKSTFDVLSELKPKWDSMTDAQRVALGDTIAGQNQYKVLASVMSNFQHAIDATNTALESAGSAAKENAAYMESLEAKENALKAEFEDFANRVLSKDVVKGFLEAGTSMLDFANNDVGAVITRIGLLTTGMTGLTGIAGQTIGKIAEVGLQLKNLGVGGGSFLGMLASGKVALIVGGVVLAVTALVEVIRALKSSYDAAHPSFEQANENLEKTQDEISQTTDKLKEYKDQLAKLDEVAVEDRGVAWQSERSELELNIEASQSYLDILERIAELQGQQAYEADRPIGYTAAGSIVKNQFQDETYYGAYQATGDRSVQLSAKQANVLNAQYSDQYQALTAITLALADATDEQYRYIEAEDLAELQGKSQEEQIEIMTEMLGKLGIVLDATYESSEQAFTNMSELANKTGELSQVQKEQAQAYIDSYAEIVKVGAATKKQVAAYVELAAKLNDVDIASGNAYEIIALLANVLSVTPAYARDLAISMGLIDANTRPAAGALVQLENGTWAVADGLNAVKTASDGVGEAMSGISVATYDTSTAAAQLTASLFDQNGQLTEAGLQALSVDSSMRSMAQAELQAQQEAASANYSNLILEIQKVGSTAMLTAEQLQTMMALASASSASDLVGGLASGGADTESSLKHAFYITFGKLAESDVALYNKWVSSRILAVGKSNYDKIMEDTQKRLDEISKNFPTGTGDGSSRKSAEEKAAEEAEKQAKKAQKAQEKAAKESQQAYESAAKSAEQAAQEAARAAEQAAEEAKQKILDSIQELKDASDDFWDSKTDAIEETNKELDRQKQLEEKLKALEEAKQKRILLYKNGQFQYDKDYGTIAKAQADYEETRDKIQRERELEQLQEMKDNATEIFNEMKDIVENGGNVTQEMINSWLSQMQADGADYYDSNKQMLSEWLDWAKGAINEISNQVASATGGSGGASGGYGSGSGSVSGQWSHQDETNPYVSLGQDTIQEMLEWIKKIDKYQDDEEFMNEIIRRAASAGYIIPSNAGLRDNLKMNLLEALQKILAPYQNLIETNTSSPYVYAWKGLFKGELQRGTDLGSNTVFAGYQDKLLSGAIDDPYEEQEYYQRNQAIKALYNEYKKITDQLGYIPDYLKDFMDMGSQMLNNVDLVARKMAENYDNLSASGKSLLDSLISGEEDYEAANKMRIAYLAENYSPERLRYMNLVRVAGSSRNAMQLMNQRTEEDKARDEALYGDWLNELRDKIDKAGGVVTDEIYKWYLKTAGGALGAKGTGDAQLYTDVFAGGGKYLYSDQEELERLGYHGFLGNFGNISEGGLSDVTKNLVKSKILTSTTETNIDKQKEQITQNNIKGIKDTLEKYQEGYGATQHWIDDASKYITDTLNKNNEALLTADAETRKSLLAQNDELMGIRDSLSGVEADKDVSKLPGSTTSYNDWEFKIENPTDEELAAKAEQRAQKLADQMAANSEAWWNASSKAEQDALHKANEELAKKINELTGSNLQYEGSTGTWSKNASGTHNFRGGLSLVGERGPELRVLGQGDSIIPAYQTANLWKWSSTTPDSMLKTLELRKGDGRNSYVFNVSKLELPNVSNAKEFVAGLKNYALQYSYRR